MNYSGKVLDLLRNPQHAGCLVGSDVVSGEANAAQNGEHVRFFLIISRGVIKHVAYEVKGRVVTRALCEYLAASLNDIKCEEALGIIAQDFLSLLSLNKLYIHALLLVRDAAQRALDSWRIANGKAENTKKIKDN